MHKKRGLKNISAAERLKYLTILLLRGLISSGEKTKIEREKFPIVANSIVKVVTKQTEQATQNATPFQKNARTPKFFY